MFVIIRFTNFLNSQYLMCSKLKRLCIKFTSIAEGIITDHKVIVSMCVGDVRK